MKQVTATMAGTIINLLVQVGEEVKSGQEVAVLESMKMQVPLTTEFAGKVKETKVQIGDFVNEGEVILLIES